MESIERREQYIKENLKKVKTNKGRREMNLSDVEIKCCEYVNLLKDIEYFPYGLYGLEEMRSELHKSICVALGLTKEQTDVILHNLTDIDNGTTVFLKLLEQKRKVNNDTTKY